MSTVLSPPQARPSQHPIWDVFGLSRFSVSLDYMHTMHLGILQHWLGSVLWTFVYDGPYTGNAQENLDRVWQR
eukprot:5614797-Alexandrium_andersonii.AAC.1